MEERTRDILAQLRRSTAAEHVRLERYSFAAEIQSQNLKLQQYRSLILGQLWAFREIERALMHFLQQQSNPQLLDFFWPRAALLRKDCLQLGNQHLLDSPCPPFPQIMNLSQALGCWYVLEGSSLGARLIYQHLRKNRAVSLGAPFHFYQESSQRTPKRWKGFITLLERSSTNPLDISEILSAASTTFEYFTITFQRAQG